MSSDSKTSLKRMRSRYRLTIMNEDTFEEIVAFRLDRAIAYIIASVLFVVLVGLTIALIAFTPLKYYIPGYGEAGKTKEYEMLQRRADSIVHVLKLQEQYHNRVRDLLKGEPLNLDTTTLDIHQTNPVPLLPSKKGRR